MPTLTQRVNLEKKDLFVADGISSKSRLGPVVRFKCKFKNKHRSTFKFTLTRTKGDDLVYSDAEKGRNARFKTSKGQGAETVVGDEVEYEREVTLPATGGLEYKIKAKQGTKNVESKTYTVTTKRRVYYQSVAMTGCAAGDLAGLEAEYAQHAVELQKTGADATIQRVDNADEGQDDVVFRRVKRVYDLAGHKPFGFVVLWARYIADIRRWTYRMSGRVTSAHPSWSWNANEESLTVEVDNDLWHALNADDDAKKRWFNSFECTFTHKDDSELHVTADKTKATIADAASGTYGGHRKIKLDLSGLGVGEVKRMKFKLAVREVAGWSGGVSFDTYAMVMIATRWEFNDIPARDQKEALHHEVGHQIGMVPDGTGTALDTPAEHYVGNGHTGNHCKTGMAYAANAWSGNAQCVMFGGDWNPPRATSFCPACAKLVKKLDLGTGMINFQYSVLDY